MFNITKVYTVGMLLKETLTVKDQVAMMINLAHDEFLESVMDGRAENYEEWALFMGEMTLKLLIPAPRV